jgi:hypothetical protein
MARTAQIDRCHLELIVPAFQATRLGHVFPSRFESQESTAFNQESTAGFWSAAKRFNLIGKWDERGVH